MAKQASRNMRPMTRWPVTLFSIAVGLFAWAQLWILAVNRWQLPAIYAEIPQAFASLVWASLMVRLLMQWCRQPKVEWQHLQDPHHAPMTALVFVSTLLFVITVHTWLPTVALLVFYIALIGQLLFGLWWMGHWWQGRRDASTVTASSYLPAVAQNLVAATAAASVGMPELAGLLFGAGVFSWLALESVIMQRAALGPALGLAQRPLQGIQIAPAVVAGLAYLAMTTGPVDLFAVMLLGYGMYQLLVAIRLVHWTCQSGVLPSYWAFSFGVVACASMAMQFHLRAPTQWGELASVLFVVANLVIASLLVITARLAWLGLLIPSAPRSAS